VEDCQADNWSRSVSDVCARQSFDSLPDAGKVSFEPRRKVSLVDVLPFLPRGDDCDDHTQKDDADDDGVAGVNWSGVLNSLIRLEPTGRVTMTKLRESLRSRDMSRVVVALA
jgi:hypothetical protein